MQSYEKTEAEKLAEIEKSKRRVQRISQVRQQANTWTFQSRQNFEAEKKQSLRQLISEVANEVANDAIRNLEELSRNHISAVGEIGAAHRAAAAYPNYEAVKELKAVENTQKAKIRHSQALKKTKLDEVRRQEKIQEPLRLRQNVRAEEDLKSKSLVERRPFLPKNVEVKPETLRDKLKREGYQQSLAKTLHVPPILTQLNTENQAPKTSLKKRKKLAHKKVKFPASKTAKPIGVPLPPAFEIAANAQNASTSANVSETLSEMSTKMVHRKRLTPKKQKQTSPSDVIFVNANIPLPPQKYKAPPGLAVRVTRDPNIPSAWDHAKLHTHEQEKKDQKLASFKVNIQKKTKQRGRKALKIARLEQRYKQLAAELMTTIDEEEEETGADLPPPSSENDPSNFVSKLNDRYEEIMAAAKAQMASLLGEQVDIPAPNWTFTPILLPQDLEIPLPLPLTIPTSENKVDTQVGIAAGNLPSLPLILGEDESFADSDSAVIDLPIATTESRNLLLGRKQEAMEAYLSVKGKLLELEEELHRRELERSEVGIESEQKQAQHFTANSQAVLLPTLTPGRANIVTVDTNGGIPAISTTPSNFDYRKQINSETVPATSQALSLPITNPEIHKSKSKPVQPSPVKQIVNRVPVQDTANATATVKSKRVSRVSVKKSQTKIAGQRKQSKLGIGGSVADGKKAKTASASKKPETRKQKIAAESETEIGDICASAVPTRIPEPTKDSQRVLRHYIEKLLQMDPDVVSHMSSSKNSPLSNSSNIRINSSAVSSSSSSYKSTCLEADYLQKRHSLVEIENWPPTGEPQNSSTPNIDREKLNSRKVDVKGRSSVSAVDSSVSSSVPNVDVNIIYESDTSKSKSNLGSPVQRITSSNASSNQSELRQRLANVCQRQAQSLYAPVTRHVAGTSSDDANAEANLDEKLLVRFAQLMAKGKEDSPGNMSSTSASGEVRLRGGTSTTTSAKSPLLPITVGKRNHISLETDFPPISPLSGLPRDHRDAFPVPPMLGQVADRWRQISIERPDWSE